MKRLCTMFRSSAWRWAVVRPSFLPLSLWRMASLHQRRSLLPENRLEIHPEVQAHVAELLLHFAQRGLSEVAHLEEFALGPGDQLADGLDALARQAVRRADRQVELADRHRQLLAQILLLGLLLPLLLLLLLVDLELAAQFEVLDEGVEVLAQDLGRLGDRLLRGDGPVGPHFEDQALVVRQLADARVLDLVPHALDRREARIDGDHSDLRLVLRVLLGRHVAAALVDGDLRGEVGVLRQRADVQVGVDDLDARLGRDRAGLHDALLGGLDPEHLLAGLGQLDDQLLEVQHDVGHVLHDALDRRELVGDALDLDGGDRGALDRRVQHAAQRVADRVGEAPLERLGEEHRVRRRGGLLVAGHAGGKLEILPADSHDQCSLFSGARTGRLASAGSKARTRRSVRTRVRILRLAPVLSRHVFDDELRLHGDLQLLGRGQRDDRARGLLLRQLQPRRDLLVFFVEERFLDDLRALFLLRGLDDVARVDLVGRDADLLPVHADVPVQDHLPRLGARAAHAQAVDDVVEAALEDLHEVLARVAGLGDRLVIVAPELALHDAVHLLGALHFAQVDAELRQADALRAVHAGRLVLFLDGALGRVAARPLEEQLGPQAAADAALRPDDARNTLNSPLLPGPAAVVRQRRHVFDHADVQAGRLQRADRALPARAGSLDLHLDLADAELLRLLRRALGRLLRRERGRLPRALVADRPGRRPAQRVAARIGDRDDRVVERGLDVADRLGDQLLHLADRRGRRLLVVRLRGLCRLRVLLLVCHSSPLIPSTLSRRLRLLLARDRLPRPLPGPRVRPRPLPAHRQAAAVAAAAVALDLLQPLDVLLDHAPQRAFDHVALVHDGVDPRQLVFRDVLDLGLRIHARFLQDLIRQRLADAEDVGQGDPRLFVRRNFDAAYASHALPLPLLVFRIRADHPHAPLATDDLTLLTDPFDGRSHLHDRL